MLLGLLGLIRTDTVLAYQRIRLFVWANSMKIVDSDTYQEIPDTVTFELSICEVALCDATAARRRAQTA